MVSPDAEFVYVVHVGVGFEGKLGQCSVVIESSHGGKGGGGKIFGVVLCNHAVSVSGVSNDNDFDVSGSVVIDCFSSVNENFSIVFQQVSSFHSGTSGFGSNK